MASIKALSLLALVNAIASAQTAPNWTQQFPPSSPPARYLHAMAYDSVRGQTLLFGGQGAIFLLNDTWVWDGANWTQKFPTTDAILLVRSQFAMAFDSTRGQVVMFGGYGGPEDGDFFALGDTWLWDGANWTEECFRCSPPGRNQSAMAYDSTHQQIVMFGGQGAGSSLLNDTWVWNGSNWTQESAQVSPPARAGHAMTYDSAHGQLVLFGGAGPPSVGLLNDTWVWDGASWTQKFPLTSPPPMSGAMAYDSAHSQVILFGENQTWVWDGSNWIEQSPQAVPPSRFGHAMSYDSINDQIVLFAGQDGASPFTLYSDTWTWIGAALPASSPSIGGVMSASAFGGFSSASPRSWVEIYGSNLAPDARNWANSDFAGSTAPISLDGVSVSVGGQAAFVDYISPTQVNAELPSNIAAGGTVPVTVTNGSMTGTPYNLNINPTEPGLLAPANFKVGSNQYVVAQCPMEITQFPLKPLRALIRAQPSPARRS